MEFAGQTESAKAGADGNWLLKLKPLKASAEPAEMVIQESGDGSQGAGQRVVLKNLLVGEVWMASGQSNMQWLAGKCDGRHHTAKHHGERVCACQGRCAVAVAPLRPVGTGAGDGRHSERTLT